MNAWLTSYFSTGKLNSSLEDTVPRISNEVAGTTSGSSGKHVSRNCGGKSDCFKGKWRTTVNPHGLCLRHFTSAMCRDEYLSTSLIKTSLWADCVSSSIVDTWGQNVNAVVVYTRFTAEKLVEALTVKASAWHFRRCLWWCCCPTDYSRLLWTHSGC